MTALRPVTDSEMAALNYDRFSDFSPLVLKRLHAIYLVAVGSFTHKTIATILGLTPDTITDYVVLFNDQGLLGLKWSLWFYVSNYQRRLNKSRAIFLTQAG